MIEYIFTTQLIQIDSFTMADTTITDVETGVDAVQETLSFPVYMIYSRWSLKKMDRFLDDYGGAGFLRIVFGKDDKETDRSIAIMSEDVYNALCEDGYGGDQKDNGSRGRQFRVVPFKLNESSFPGEGRSRTLFVPAPKVLADDEDWMLEKVKEKFRYLEEWGVLPADSWNVSAPLKSRENGGVRGGCFITFKRDVELERIAMARIVLTDTYWPVYDEEERAVFRCYWARERKERKPEEKAKTQVKEKKSPEEAQKEKKKEVKRRRVEWAVKDAKPVKKAPVVPEAVQPTLQ